MAKRDNGFTLIEITIALLIMAIGLVGLLTLFPVGFDASKRAGDVTVATFLAQEKIEEEKRRGFDSYGSLANSSGTFPDPYGGYDYSVVINTDPTGTGLAVTEITVTVYWPTGTTDRRVELKTYVADYGP